MVFGVMGPNLFETSSVPRGNNLCAWDEAVNGNSASSTGKECTNSKELHFEFKANEQALHLQSAVGSGAYIYIPGRLFLIPDY